MSTVIPVRGAGGATERGRVSLSVPRFGRLLPFFDSTSLQVEGIPGSEKKSTGLNISICCLGRRSAQLTWILV